MLQSCAKLHGGLQLQHPQSSLSLFSPSSLSIPFMPVVLCPLSLANTLRISHFGDSNHIRHVAQSNDQLPPLPLPHPVLQSPTSSPLPFLLLSCLFSALLPALLSCPFSLVLTTCFSCSLQLAAADNLWGIVYLGACCSSLYTPLPPPPSPSPPLATLPQRPLIKYSISATTPLLVVNRSCSRFKELLLLLPPLLLPNNNNNKKCSRAHAGHALFNLPQQSLHVWPWQLWQSNQQKVKTNFEADIEGN